MKRDKHFAGSTFCSKIQPPCNYLASEINLLDDLSKSLEKILKFGLKFS
jgi:hypothetical protein